ncbi:c6 zinc finger domain containing protein [Niveomyces insectorum RCEF 264]|uniref:C6 zinc finger domain containing protein n=1 Tax=Niveomyces insectorum RCEF 264 TaxID=1081102 RepID=A0A167TD90_9HYPO|nr:c6 zinc finger domain containing protein [Niveomyces insectorum RCEF 264]
MESLRDTYAAAEIAKGFVESLLKKAGIDLMAVANLQDDGLGAGAGVGVGVGVGGLGGGAVNGAENGGTGTSTPVNGTSASLLNATSNVGVPYTEDGIAHAVAVYAANTPRARSARTTPPADTDTADRTTDDDGGGSGGHSHMTNGHDDLLLGHANTSTTPSYISASAAAAKLLALNIQPMPGSSNTNANVNANAAAFPSSDPGANPANPANPATAVATAMATANTAVEQMWGLTPSGSAVSEDPFEWGVAADPGSMKLDLDFDQWLDFPPEGMGSSADQAFAGLFKPSYGNEAMNTDF